MHRMLLLATALWTSPPSFVWAMRDAMKYESTLNEDEGEICCVCQEGEITYPAGSICPATCVQRPEQGGCSVEADPITIVRPTTTTTSHVIVSKVMCCVCPNFENGGKDEVTLSRALMCPQGCIKKGEGTLPGERFHGQGDTYCTI